MLLTMPLEKAYDYAVPEGMEVEVGSYVEVPFGKKLAVGVVWEVKSSSNLDIKRIKNIVRKFDVLSMPQVSMDFVRWVADYTMAPIGSILRMAVSAPYALEAPRPITGYRLKNAELPQGFRLTDARKRIIDILSKQDVVSSAELRNLAKCGAATITAMVDAGVIEPVLMPTLVSPLPPGEGWGEGAIPSFSKEQQDAIAFLRIRLHSNDFSVTLLDGVTGSGKTEVYLEAISICIAQGKQALVLLPEIALSPQFMDRFSKRFGASATAWHSDLTIAQRKAAWRSIADGTARVVVGARSALFLPFPKLGLVVVDEEHEGAFKQEEGVTYHARDMAVVRGRIGHIPVVLVSATPSLETMANVENGRYARVILPERHGNATLPQISLIDLRKEKPGQRMWLAAQMYSAIEKTINNKEQVLLFLNRRGYAPLTLCRACGHRLQCPNCTAWLVEHKKHAKLSCHHCGYATALPKNCTACGAEGKWAACGPGVERVAEEVTARFPSAKIVVLASDLLEDNKAMQKAFEDIEAGKIDIIIGTQIVAKGHHFPNLTLVGVVDADLGLSGGDLRAAEKTYQLLHQVAGRAGRADRPGVVLLQTYYPEHPVMQALANNDRDGFMRAEAEERQRHEMPPFGRLVAITVSGADQAKVDAVAKELGRNAPRAESLTVLGPAPAPISIVRGRHRRRLLLKAPRNIAIQPLVRKWLEQVKPPSSVQVRVDVDPYSFF